MFSPSLGGNSSYYTYYAEYFAKRGYLVLGINHQFESEAVLDHNWNLTEADHAYQDGLKRLKIPEEITADGYREAMGVRQEVLARDLLFALDQLLRVPELGARVNPTQIGAFGHSIGGAAVVYAALLDDRIRAVIDLDGTPPSLALRTGIGVPFLFVEDRTDYHNHPGRAIAHQRRSDFCALNRADSWRILIEGFDHNSFLDVAYFTAKDGESATKHKAKLDTVVRSMESFLRRYLLEDQAVDLTSLQSASVEVLPFLQDLPENQVSVPSDSNRAVEQ